MDIKYVISKLKDSKIQEVKDSISVEEPLEMRLKYKEADKEHARITPYMAKFHGEFWKASKYWHNAAIIKASLEYVGLTGGPVRPPFRELNKEEKNELFNIMSDMDVKKKN